jgi:excisionase family DNA binding protein
VTVVPLGRVVATPGALPLAEEQGVSITSLLRRHAAGDWGDVDAHDKRVNDEALANGSRILSSYGKGTPAHLWIITEAATDACPACTAGVGTCEPDKGEWHARMHFRTDLPGVRLSTTVLRPRISDPARAVPEKTCIRCGETKPVGRGPRRARPGERDRRETSAAGGGARQARAPGSPRGVAYDREANRRYAVTLPGTASSPIRSARASDSGGEPRVRGDRLLTASEVAELLAVPGRWVREHTRSGLIPHIRLGRYVRYRPDAVLAWIGDQEGGGEAWQNPAARGEEASQ